jgi:hypothetical protein
MSQVAHPRFPTALPSIRRHRLAWLVALLAVTACVAVVLVSAIDGGSSDSSASSPGATEYYPRPDAGSPSIGAPSGGDAYHARPN